MSEAIPEPTDDATLDGTQIPTHFAGWPDEEGDAGVGDVDIEDEELIQ